MFYSYPYKALSFPIQCVWLKLNGSWPLTESSRPWRSQSFLATAYIVWAWYVIASVAITISYQTAFLLNNLSDIIITTENCCTTFMGVLNFVRLIHLRLNQRKFRQLIENFSYEIWIPDFAKRLEDFFNPILLANLTISSVLICMVGFQIITGKNMFIGDYVKFIIYISSALSQLYVLCENGDALIKQSTLTAQILYECQWEGSDRIEIHSFTPTSKRIRNQIWFMILCSQQPVRITAFKFSTLSLQSFTAILSTSISYFTLLRSVYFDDEKKLD
ncbi:GM22603 [Drosophila sechellia]|uniref:GM22603 n=1 Tax=Drosophila sechellia TaxID=7238 RepID=B4IKH4_DROSE|nr:GM22603 [Drosophila sechellia]